MAREGLRAFLTGFPAAGNSHNKARSSRGIWQHVRSTKETHAERLSVLWTSYQVTAAWQAVARHGSTAEGKLIAICSEALIVLL